VVEIFFEDVEILDLRSEFFHSWLGKVCEQEEKELDVVSLIFCSDEYLLKMNQEHLEHDYYTDIITFDYSSGYVISGDLFISIDRVKDNAGINQVTFMNELHRVVVHGVLHLIGYNDKSESEQKEMRSLENKYLEIVSRETI